MEEVGSEMLKMLEWVPERNRNGPRPSMGRVLELVSDRLKEKNKEIDRLKDQDPEKQEEHREMLGKWELKLRREVLEFRNQKIDLKQLKDKAEKWERIAPQLLACQKFLREIHGLDTGRTLSTSQVSRLTAMVFPAYNRCDLQYIDGGLLQSWDFTNHPELANDIRIQR